MSGRSRVWPPQGACFAPRLGEYLARLEQQPLAALLAQPASLGRALRRASNLLALEVECLDVPATWMLHSAGWPGSVGEHGVELGCAPAELRAPAETVGGGPLAAVREALRTLPPFVAGPATLIALPSPATLAEAAGPNREPWSRGVLQALIRAVGELDVLVGVMFEGDDGVASLAGVLAHYRLSPVCIRRLADTRPPPPSAFIARALSLEALIAGSSSARDPLVTSDGALPALAEPEDLVKASRALAARTVG